MENQFREGIFLVNDPDKPARYGRVNIVDIPRRRNAAFDVKSGVLCKTVLTGFCGTDLELLRMGRRGELGPKFPPGQERLIPGHEGVVYIPSEDRYAVPFIRGGSGYDPTRYSEDEELFEYGCHKQDGLMCFENYFNPDMLIRLPGFGLRNGRKIPLHIAVRLAFSDPYACVLFLRERIRELAEGHNFRLYTAQDIPEHEAKRLARKNAFERTVIFGLGTTGLFAALAIGEKAREMGHRVVAVARSEENHPKVEFLRRYAPSVTYIRNEGDPGTLARKIWEVLGGNARVFVGCSGTDFEARVAFDEGVLGNNSIYSCFSLGPSLRINSMQFAFANQLIYGAVNFRYEHMEEAVRRLLTLPIEELVDLCDVEDLKADPTNFIEGVFGSSSPALKKVVVWDGGLIEDRES